MPLQIIALLFNARIQAILESNDELLTAATLLPAAMGYLQALFRK